MISKPILFSAPMVRSLLNGTKTQTRRKIAFPPSTGAFVCIGQEDGSWWPYVSVDGESTQDQNGDERPMKCPHPVGSEMWVRETWGYRGGVFHCGDEKDRFGEADIHYKADDSRARFRVPFDWSAPKLICRCKGGDDYPGQEGPTDEHVAEMKRHWASWRPSIFMPRIFSRLTLKVTDVRVQRLQDISEEDAKAEGLKCLSKDGGQVWKWGIPDSDGEPGNDDHGWHWHRWSTSPVEAYRTLWESINGSGSWDANPWVWSYTFERVS